MSELNLLHSNGNKVKLTTPDTLAADKTFKLPGADGSSGQFLRTNGSGALSFATPSPATGSVIQVVNMTLADGNEKSSTTESTWLINQQANGTQHKLAITPQYSNSKLLIQVTGHAQYYVDTTGNAGNIKARLYNETASGVTHLYGTVVYHYTGGYTRLGGSWGHNILINAGSTSARTYRVEYYFDGQQTYYYGGGSDSITIMEIAG